MSSSFLKYQLIGTSVYLHIKYYMYCVYRSIPSKSSVFAGISLTRWFPDSWGCWYFPVCWCTSGDQCGANAGASLTPESSQSSFQSSAIIICKPGSRVSKFPKIAASNPLIFEKITWQLPKMAMFVSFQVSQVAGLLTDNFALKRMYVASEALNLVGDLRVEIVKSVCFFFKGRTKGWEDDGNIGILFLNRRVKFLTFLQFFLRK